MTATELISNLRALGLQDAHVVFRHIADNLCKLRLANGREIEDRFDCKELLCELAEAARVLDLSSGTEVSVTAGGGTRPKVLSPAPQRRYDSRHDPTCPRCGHVHEGIGECAMYMGNGRYCRCELEVPA